MMIAVDAGPWMRAAVIAMCLLGAAMAESAAAEPAGAVERIQGTAIATLGTFSRPLQHGSDVFVGDRLATSEASRLRIRFLDGAIMTLGDSSTMIIEAFESSGPAPVALLDVVQGVFLAASGAIARMGSDGFQIRTPSAIIGVRGTELWGHQSGDTLEIAFLSGTAIVVSTPQGAVALTEPLTGITVLAGTRPPEPKRWPEARLTAAARMTAFD